MIKKKRKINSVREVIPTYVIHSMMINHNMKSFFFKCTALYDSFPISRIFYEYIYHFG